MFHDVDHPSQNGNHSVSDAPILRRSDSDSKSVVSASVIGSPSSSLMRYANPTGNLWPSVSLRSALELVLDPVASSEGQRAKSPERQRHSSTYLYSDSFSLFYVVRECLLHIFHRDAVGKRKFAATKTYSTW